MSSRNAVVSASVVARSMAVAVALCLLAVHASAQTAIQPKDEIFGGYAWLAPNGWGDLDYKINHIPNAFDASNTFYFSGMRNLGILVDGSGHFNGGTTPRTLLPQMTRLASAMHWADSSTSTIQTPGRRFCVLSWERQICLRIAAMIPSGVSQRVAVADSI